MENIAIFEPIKLVYAAQSKHYFFCRDAVTEFILRAGAAPLHPFRLYDYFLGDRVERDLIRRANNTIVMRADEIWVFGEEIADGVLVEISHGHENNRPVRLFSIATRASEIRRLDASDISFETELVELSKGDVRGLRDVVEGKKTFRDVVPD